MVGDEKAMPEFTTKIETLCREARALLPAARQDAGYYDTDFDLQPSRAYERYFGCWVQLRKIVARLKPPRQWVELFEWTREHDDFFPGVAPYGQFVMWNERQYSLRGALLEEMGRLARNRPKAAVWDDPALQEMLADPGWSEQIEWRRDRSELLTRISRHRRVKLAPEDPSRKAVEGGLEPSRLFDVTSLKLTVGPRVVRCELGFSQHLLDQAAFVVVVVDADSRKSGAGMLSQMAWRVDHPGLKPYSLIETTRVSLRGRRLTLRVPRPLWDDSPLASARRLGIYVEFYGHVGGFYSAFIAPGPG